MTTTTIVLLAGDGLLILALLAGVTYGAVRRRRPSPVLVVEPGAPEPERHAWPEPQHPRITDQIAHPPARHTPDAAPGTRAQRWDRATITGEIVLQLDEETGPIAAGRAAVKHPGGLRTVPDAWPGRVFVAEGMPLAADWFSPERMRVEVDA